MVAGKQREPFNLDVIPIDLRSGSSRLVRRGHAWRVFQPERRLQSGLACRIGQQLCCLCDSRGNGPLAGDRPCTVRFLPSPYGRDRPNRGGCNRQAGRTDDD